MTEGQAIKKATKALERAIDNYVFSLTPPKVLWKYQYRMCRIFKRRSLPKIKKHPGVIDAEFNEVTGDLKIQLNKPVEFFNIKIKKEDISE